MTLEATGQHHALIYRGVDEFVDEVSGFVREGIAEGERIGVLVGREKLDRLRDALGAQSAAVSFFDVSRISRPQLVFMRSTLEFVRSSGSQPSRVVAEQELARKTVLEVADYHRIEAAANVVYGAYPVSILCPYDAAALSEEVLSACAQTHGYLRERQGLRISEHFVDPSQFIKSCTVVDPPGDAPKTILTSRKDLAGVRSFLRAEAARHQLAPETLDELLSASSEVLSHALKNGRTPSQVFLYREDSAVVCHVHDDGPEYEVPLFGYLPPAPDEIDQRWLWLARQLCDAIEVATDATGTHIRLISLVGRDEGPA